MGMQDLDWCSFWWRDWLSSARVVGMTAEERGAYIQLLAHAWVEDGLPDDLARLAKWAGVAKLSDDVLACFPIAADGLRRNERQERERLRAKARHASSTTAARARWGKKRVPGPLEQGSDAAAMRPQCDRNAGAMPLDETRREEKKKKEPRKRVPAADAASVPIPMLLDTDRFREAWTAFLAERAANKKPVTERAAGMLLRKMQPWGPEKAIRALEASIVGRWSGVFEPTDAREPHASQAPPPPPTREVVQKIDRAAHEREILRRWERRHTVEREMPSIGGGLVKRLVLDAKWPGYEEAAEELKHPHPTDTLVSKPGQKPA